MAKVLYRKYRSKALNEIAGQELIVKTLKNALKANRLGHAILLSGPRGVGKTSIARILAHAVNNLEYSGESKHLDIIEIDAASNRGIDDARDLREKARILPSSARYKVYIIDEVHMLTRDAFNALLKTLEEPPEHVIFILATTELHKLPETIISRAQVFNFRPISEEVLKTELAKIAQKEEINITTEALELVAKHGQGSFRDSLTILDQARFLAETIEPKHVEQLLGIAPDEEIDNLYEAVASGNVRSAHQILERLRDFGAEATLIAKSLGTKLRLGLLTNEPALKHTLTLKLLNELLEVGASQNPFAKLEIAVYAAALDSDPDEKPKAKDASEEAFEPKVGGEIEPISTKHPAKLKLELESLWPEVLNTLKTQKGLLYSVARLAKPRLDSNELKLEFEFNLHKDRANQPNHRSQIEKIIKELTGKDIEVICLQTDKKASSYKQVVHNGRTIKNISNIFGESEVLES